MKCPPVRILKPQVSLTNSNTQILQTFQCIRGCIADPVLIVKKREKMDKKGTKEKKERIVNQIFLPLSILVCMSHPFRSIPPRLQTLPHRGKKGQPPSDIGSCPTKNGWKIGRKREIPLKNWIPPPLKLHPHDAGVNGADAPLK